MDLAIDVLRQLGNDLNHTYPRDAALRKLQKFAGYLWHCSPCTQNCTIKRQVGSFEYICYSPAASIASQEGHLIQGFELERRLLLRQLEAPDDKHGRPRRSAQPQLDLRLHLRLPCHLQFRTCRNVAIRIGPGTVFSVTRANPSLP